MAWRVKVLDGKMKRVELSAVDYTAALFQASQELSRIATLAKKWEVEGPTKGKLTLIIEPKE